MDVVGIDENKITVHLTTEEIYILFGGYDKINYTTSDSIATMNILYKKATESTDFAGDAEKLLIEVKPLDSGCEICFTKLKCKAKNQPKKSAIRFDNIENLIAYILTLNEQLSDLILFGNDYFLILYNGYADRYAVFEYNGKPIKNITAIEYIYEHGKMLCKATAIKDFKSIFKVT